MPDTRARLTGFAWKATGGSTWLAPGLVTGGNPGIEEAWSMQDGAGAVQLNHAGDVELAPSLDVQATIDTFDLIAHGLRATYPRGAQTGVDDSASSLAFMATTDLASYTYGLGAVNKWRLSWGGEVMTASFDLLALQIGAPTTAITMVAPASTELLTAKNLSVSRAGSDCDCVGVDLDCDNGLKAVALGNGRTSTHLRHKDSIEQALETLSLTLRVRIPEAVTVGGDTAPTPATDITIAATAGVVTKTLTFTNVQPYGPGWTVRQREDGYVVHAQRYLCPRGCLALT